MAKEAHSDNTHSSVDSGPLPMCAVDRVSTMIVMAGSQGCSSRRTISSPRFALILQCTRRIPSP